MMERTVEGTTAEETLDEDLAPFYHVPEALIVSIEHPCIIKDFDRGWSSLGGEHHVKHVSYTAARIAHGLEFIYRFRC